MDERVFYEDVFVARQPIFDAKEKVWSYELLFRHSGEAGFARIENADVATSSVVADGVDLVRGTLDPGQRLFINFPRNLLVQGAAMVLPPDICVIEILETVRPEPEVLEALKKLKNHGYTLALDDFVGQKGMEELLDLADIVKIDVLGVDQAGLAELGEKFLRGRKAVLAEKVETREVFNQARQIGYKYFQGYFFAKPEVVPGRKLTSNQVSRMRLLSQLAGGEFNVKDISKTIESDLSLSYRLLKYINSAAFGLMKKVSAINQAVVLLGNKKLVQWLQVVSMADLNNSPKACEMVFISARRARFLELLAGLARRTSSDSAFLMGLFSMLDAILNMPMHEILNQLPLDEQIQEALQGEQTPARALLDLVVASEKGDWERVAALVEDLGVTPKDIAGINTQAMTWAQDLVHHSMGSASGRERSSGTCGV